MRYGKVHIEISNVCNLQCSFCPEVIRTKKLMDLELFTRAIQQVAPIADQVAFHLMGDPLIHPKLAEMVEICDQHQVKIFFVTNGVLLRPPQQELLLHSAFRQVNFSLHSFSDNFPDRDPSEYLLRIFEFTEMAMQRRPDLYVNFRLWNLQSVHVTSAQNHELLNRICQRFGTELPLDFNVRSKKSFRIKGRLYLHFDTEFIWPSLDGPRIGTQGTCYGLSSHFGILADGTVVPCCLDKEGAIPLGNLENQLLEEILNGDRAKAILKGFHSGHLVEKLCQGCNYIERFSSAKMLDRFSTPPSPSSSEQSYK